MVHAHESTESISRWISVVGVGELQKKPDLAMLRLGVVSAGKSTAMATDSNNKAIRSVISALSKMGLGEDDFETTRFQISPQRQYRKDQPPLISGYQVTNALVVRIQDLERVGEIMQAAIDAGGNHFESISYVLSDTEQHRKEARVLAVENARKKAISMAMPLDAKVGSPLSIQEIRRGEQPFHATMRMESADALHASVPVKGPSELSIVCEVQIKFSLE